MSSTCSDSRYDFKTAVAGIATELRSGHGYSVGMKLTAGADYILKALKHSKLSQAELQRRIAKRTGQNIDRSFVNKVLKGKRLVKPEEIDAAFSETGLPLPAALRRGVIEVPIVSWVSAGRMTEVAPVTSAEALSKVPVSGLSEGDWIALRVNGDSMNLIAPEESLIFVNRRDRELVDGAFYIFAEPDGSSTFKQYGAEPPRMEPVSSNRRHRVKIAKSEINVIGRVRRVMVDL